MFEEIWFMIGFWIFCIIISYILITYTPQPLSLLVRLFAMIGIIIHELCHLLMCALTGIPIEEVKLLERVKMTDGKGSPQYSYGGHIHLRRDAKLTFLQALLAGLAPLLFSFWIFFSVLNFLFSSPNIDVLYFYLLVILLFSIILATAPSAADLFNIPDAFGNDVSYSFYQLFLVVLAIFPVWILSDQLNLVRYHEIVIYILIGVFYYCFKYSVKGIQLLYRSSSNSIYKHSTNKYKNYTMKNLKKYSKR